MTSSMDTNYKCDRENSVIGYITVYKYGRMFTPAVFDVCKTKDKIKRSISSLKSQLFDRPSLISKIHHLLDEHRRKRNENVQRRTRCSMQLHKELLSLIRTCYEQLICESRLFPVGELFLELFLCTGNTMAVYCLLTEGLTSSLSYPSLQMDSNVLYHHQNSSDCQSAFEYYLHHVSSISKHGNKKYDFINSEIDRSSGMTPLSAAVQKRDPALILVLLRYGADPFLSSVNASFDDKLQNPTEQLIDDLNGLFLFKNTGFSEETRAKLAAEEAKVWKCLTYFRRAVPGIPIKSTTHIVTTYDEDDQAEGSKVEYMDDRFLAKQMYGIHPGIAELIDFDYFKPTVSLKHLCRCSLRQHLQHIRPKISSLPKGIQLLPLPKQLKEYLDLQTD